MPIKIPDALPAGETLVQENIFVMDEGRAFTQDIRPLRVVILNLMPTKIITETQLLRLLSNTPLQLELILLHPMSHNSRHTPREHLLRFYRTFPEIKAEKFDGMIITGAPVENLKFNEVDYWDELSAIMDWSVTNVFSTFFLCYAAQAGLYHYYGIPKYLLPQKIFGVFPHYATRKNAALLRGFDDIFFVPHSRHAEVKKEDIEKIPELEILAESPEAGIYIVSRTDGRQVFVTGHSEYDSDTLRVEYERDLSKGLAISPPKNYFPDDDPQQEPRVNWRSHASLLFANWLNYCVYQETPYDLEQLNRGY